MTCWKSSRALLSENFVTSAMRTTMASIRVDIGSMPGAASWSELIRSLAKGFTDRSPLHLVSKVANGCLSAVRTVSSRISVSIWALDKPARGLSPGLNSHGGKRRSFLHSARTISWT